MLKRPLDTENKENEPVQSTISGSLLSKPIDTNEPPPAKKAKIIETENDQEQEFLSDEESELSSNEEESIFFSDEDDQDSDEDDQDTDSTSNEEEDEEQGPCSISSVIVFNDGTIDPTNKQYFIYENTEPPIISRTARFWSRRYLKILPHVDPDNYDMYIHNDFICYGELEIIENCLVDIAKTTFLKHKNQMNLTHYITAFRRLEALNIVLKCANSFVGIDDGQRFSKIMRVIGACYISILAGLLPPAMYNNGTLFTDDIKKLKKISKQIPNFKQIIKQALLLGHMYSKIGPISSAYMQILQVIYCNWSLIMEENKIDLTKQPDEKDEDIWNALKYAAKIKRNAYQESFDFIKELQLYSTNHPDLGGHAHDLRTWSKTRRNLFSFDKMDDDDDNSNEPDGNFWFRM